MTIDASGRPVSTPLTRRIIGIQAAQLAAVPDVTALTYGIDKVPATRAALSSGMLHGLVTSSDLAKGLLASGPL